MDSELRWDGGRWVYGVQMLACAGVLYYRTLATPKVAAVDKVAVRLPVSFVAFQRTFLAVFFLASGLVTSFSHTNQARCSGIAFELVVVLAELLIATEDF